MFKEPSQKEMNPHYLTLGEYSLDTQKFTQENADKLGIVNGDT